MKKFLKIILEIILVLVILSLILVFLGISAKSEIVPDIYATSESGKKALAIKGGYKWNSFSASIVSDAILPEEYVYTSNNTLLVTPNEKIIFQNSDNSLECYKFYQLEMKYQNESNEVFEVPEREDSNVYSDLKYLELNAPENEGTYIYNFTFSYYTKGEVTYGLKVVVSTEPNYEIEDLINFKNTSLTDVDSINDIIKLLPYSKYKIGIIVKMNSAKRNLIINCTEIVMERKELMNNIIALFTLIPDLDMITYKSDKETYTFTREEIENQVGRELVDYVEDMELWKREILFKEKIIDEKSSRDTIYKAILADIFSEFITEDTDKILIDTNSFKKPEVLKISEVDAQEILEYASTFSTTVYDIGYEDYQNLNSEDLLISLVSIKNKATYINEIMSGDYIEEEITNTEINNIWSGDIGNDYKNQYICTIFVSKNKRSSLYNYELEFKNEKWNITEL